MAKHATCGQTASGDEVFLRLKQGDACTPVGIFEQLKRRSPTDKIRAFLFCHIKLTEIYHYIVKRREVE